MNNFSELLAIDLSLTVTVNGQTQVRPLLEPMEFKCTDIVEIDGIAVLPRYRHLAQHGKLVIDRPFYQWYHQVSGQGWLLQPQM